MFLLLAATRSTPRKKQPKVFLFEYLYKITCLKLLFFVLNLFYLILAFWILALETLNVIAIGVGSTWPFVEVAWIFLWIDFLYLFATEAFFIISDIVIWIHLFIMEFSSQPFQFILEQLWIACIYSHNHIIFVKS